MAAAPYWNYARHAGLGTFYEVAEHHDEPGLVRRWRNHFANDEPLSIRRRRLINPAALTAVSRLARLARVARKPSPPLGPISISPILLILFVDLEARAGAARSTSLRPASRASGGALMMPIDLEKRMMQMIRALARVRCYLAQLGRPSLSADLHLALKWHSRRIEWAREIRESTQSAGLR